MAWEPNISLYKKPLSSFTHYENLIQVTTTVGPIRNELLVIQDEARQLLKTQNVQRIGDTWSKLFKGVCLLPKASETKPKCEEATENIKKFHMELDVYVSCCLLGSYSYPYIFFKISGNVLFSPPECSANTP